MAKKKVQLQQGDVVLESSRIPADAKAVKGAVLAEGEGHHLHRFRDPQAVTVYEKGGVKYARVSAPTVIEHVTPDGRHGEHKPIAVEPGDYTFGQVSEYDYLAEMARTVVD